MQEVPFDYRVERVSIKEKCHFTTWVCVSRMERQLRGDGKTGGQQSLKTKKKPPVNPSEFVMSQATARDLERPLSIQQRQELKDHLDRQARLAAVGNAAKLHRKRQEFRGGEKVYITTPIPGKDAKVQSGFVSCVDETKNEITVTYYLAGMIQLVDGQEMKSETFTVPEGRTMFGKVLPNGCFKSIRILE